MEIDAQVVIDKLTRNFSRQVAEAQKSNAILESQVEMLQTRNASLETENSNLANELTMVRSEQSSQHQASYIEGDVLGS